LGRFLAGRLAVLGDSPSCPGSFSFTRGGAFLAGVSCLAWGAPFFFAGGTAALGGTALGGTDFRLGTFFKTTVAAPACDSATAVGAAEGDAGLKAGSFGFSVSSLAAASPALISSVMDWIISRGSN